MGKKPIRVVEVQMEAIIGWLIKGYQTYNKLACHNTKTGVNCPKKDL
jgi:hypothetical protein